MGVTGQSGPPAAIVTNVYNTAASHNYVQDIVIYSDREEAELFGLFDEIEPKMAYTVTYDHPRHSTCSFHIDSSGDIYDSLRNKQVVCYDAKSRTLMLPNEIHQSGKSCVTFYQIWDPTMKDYK